MFSAFLRHSRAGREEANKLGILSFFPHCTPVGLCADFKTEMNCVFTLFFPKRDGSFGKSCRFRLCRSYQSTWEAIMFFYDLELFMLQHFSSLSLWLWSFRLLQIHLVNKVVISDSAPFATRVLMRRYFPFYLLGLWVGSGPEHAAFASLLKEHAKADFCFHVFSEKGGCVVSLNVSAAKVTNFHKKDFSFCLIQTFHSFDLILNRSACALRTALPKKNHTNPPPSSFPPAE